ncbi:MAG TPA: UDP-N-acetylmuramoyl-L-alanyl-D-glutamate--2,6-diaminopimelate ligase [Candidatus Omnitrophica bacterium]|nr:UDP-N-acetylmuramoyl-L-alanyl-D-glutamate--2,6-diaminopimelate ligase [Candidatus Omnitrophota bacterium]
MKLEALLAAIPVSANKNWNGAIEINRVLKDSRQIQPGDLFVACRGPQSDGHDFIAEVLARGAAAIVYEKASVTLPLAVVGIQVQDSQKIFPELLKRVYGFHSDSLNLIGVTGTNGKTTITQLFYKLLATRFKAGTIGTLSYELPLGSRESGNTTPGPETLIPLLAEMAAQGAQYVSMEVSSHALDQNRVAGLAFELAVFTQLTQDHLDYHQNLENYFQAKRKLFSTLQPKRMLINKDCSYGRRLLAELPQAKSFSIESEADYQAVNIQESLNGCRFELVFRGLRLPVQIQLPLHYNISNCTAVLAGLDLLGLDLKDYLPVLAGIPFVPGRMERVPHPEIYFFVDYAHTPDAFVQVLKHVRLQKPKKIITVFGCGGDRDRTKRPKMTRAAAEDSDVLVMTSDNPRTENPQGIMDEMKTGLTERDRTRIQIIEELDRRKAIHLAVQLARPGDAVLVLGKGHEDYQIIGKEKHHFSDRETLLEALKV